MRVVESLRRTGAWLRDPGFGVYVHIPFCRHRCHYCDFNTYEGQDDLHGTYVEALVAEIRRWTGETRPATSVFFGGGTPTLLEPAALARILEAIRDRVGVSPDAEITIEANPETIDLAKLEGLRAAGFNRLSIGVQSLAPHVLRGLGRTHSATRAVEALATARRAGFDDVNVDLIYGSPWETAADWKQSLEGIVEGAPDHVSAYALTVEQGTPLATLVATGRVPDVDADVQAARHEIADELLGAAGFERYEISNWARPERACRHNLVYWSAGDYLGFGAGAHAHISGRRWWSVRLPRDFIERVGSDVSTIDGEELLDPDARAGEALMLGLRLTSGIDVDGFVERFGADAWASRRVIGADLERMGVAEWGEGWLRLAPRATMVANDVLARLL